METPTEQDGTVSTIRLGAGELFITYHTENTKLKLFEPKMKQLGQNLGYNFLDIDSTWLLFLQV